MAGSIVETIAQIQQQAATNADANAQNQAGQFDLSFMGSGDSGERQAGLEKYMGSMQSASLAANASNEQRYQHALSALSSGHEQGMAGYQSAIGSIENLGQSSIEDANRGAVRTKAMGNQSLISSGLSNTTMKQNMSRGIEEDRVRSVQRINEGVGLQRSGLEAQMGLLGVDTSRTLASLIEARNDVGPDPAMAAQLAASAAQGTASRANFSTSSGGLPSQRTGGVSGGSMGTGTPTGSGVFRMPGATGAPSSPAQAASAPTAPATASSGASGMTVTDDKSGASESWGAPSPHHRFIGGQWTVPLGAIPLYNKWKAKQG